MNKRSPTKEQLCHSFHLKISERKFLPTVVLKAIPIGNCLTGCPKGTKENDFLPRVSFLFFSVCLCTEYFSFFLSIFDHDPPIHTSPKIEFSLLFSTSLFSRAVSWSKISVSSLSKSFFIQPWFQRWREKMWRKSGGGKKKKCCDAWGERNLFFWRAPRAMDDQEKEKKTPQAENSRTQ